METSTYEPERDEPDRDLRATPSPDPVAGTSKVVAARLRYLERQGRQAPAGGVAAGAGRAPLGSGPANRHGMPKVPVGQRVVKNWPVLDLGDQPDVSREAWRLRIHGLCHAPRTLTFDDLAALPRTELELDFHCVTTWSRLDLRVVGVRLRDVLAEVAPDDAAAFVSFTAYDRLPGTEVPYTTNLPLARASEPDVVLAYEVDGAPLPREHGGPVRVIVPRLYAWKGAKWVRDIELLDADRPGFWEVRGYSNTAEPWQNDRYSGR